MQCRARSVLRARHCSCLCFVTVCVWSDNEFDISSTSNSWKTRLFHIVCSTPDDTATDRFDTKFQQRIGSPQGRCADSWQKDEEAGELCLSSTAMRTLVEVTPGVRTAYRAVKITSISERRKKDTLIVSTGSAGEIECAFKRDESLGRVIFCSTIILSNEMYID